MDNEKADLSSVQNADRLRDLYPACNLSNEILEYIRWTPVLMIDP